MKRFTAIIFPALLTILMVLSPAFLEARGGGHGGGHGGGRGGSHGGSHHGGHRGGHGFRGSTFFGFGAGFVTGYAAPWGYPYYYYPGYYYYPESYPGYYSPDYYYSAPQHVPDSSSGYQEPPPGYFESAPGPQGTGDRTYTTSPETIVPPNPNQTRCLKWAPTGGSHTESRWNPQTQSMESVTVPNFAWQDYPCN